MNKNIAVVMKLPQEKWKEVEDFLDNIGATIIFVKIVDCNRRLIVKNLAGWEKEEKENGESL